MNTLYNYTQNYPATLPKYQTHWKEEMISKQVIRTISQYRQYCATVLNAHFGQVFIKSKIAKQLMYNWLQLAKILSKFYRKEFKAAEGDATIISFPLTLGRFLEYEHSEKKYSINEHE